MADKDLVREILDNEGKITCVIPARALDIVWGDAPENWNWKSVPDSGEVVQEVAELLKVSYLGISARLDISMLSSDTNYASYLVFKWAAERSGFENHVTEVGIGILGGTRVTKSPLRLVQDLQPMEKYDLKGWLEIELGEIFIKESNNGLLETYMRQVLEDELMKGMIVHSIEVRPFYDAVVEFGGKDGNAELKKRSEELESKNSELEKKVSDLENEKSKLEGDKNQCKGKDHENEKLNKKLSELESKYSELEKKVSELENEKSKLEADMKQCQQCQGKVPQRGPPPFGGPGPHHWGGPGPHRGGHGGPPHRGGHGGRRPC